MFYKNKKYLINLFYLLKNNKNNNAMAKQIFINLAVNDLQKSMDFYAALGFENNPQFSDDNAKCMTWSEHIFVMLLTHDKFNNFTIKPIADTKTNIAGLFSLSLNSLDEVNNLIENGLKAGGIEPSEFKDYGFMQQRTIEDFDGHTWEVFYMDMTKFPIENPVE
jgi:predicted lactoylglutathione lyase